MIYIVWRMHHDLFREAEIISRRAFLFNGIWLFFLTLVPFTTGWVGSAPDASVPAFLYPLNLLFWCISFHLMNYQIERDNPGIRTLSKKITWNRIIMYVGYTVSMILAFIMPEWSMRVIHLKKILFINASPNRNGNTVSCVKKALKGLEYETLHLVDYRISQYGAVTDDDQIEDVFAKIDHADILVVGVTAEPFCYPEGTV